MEWRERWIRVAGHAKRIREGDANHWRCYVDAQAPEMPVRSFRVVGGAASPSNVVPGTDPAAGGPLGLTAWIDFYGDLKIEDGIALISLKEPL